MGVIKTPKSQELPGALTLDPCWGTALDPTRALERAPGPHAVNTLHSTWTQSLFIQYPAVTNSAHGHVKIHICGRIKGNEWDVANIDFEL